MKSSNSAPKTHEIQIHLPGLIKILGETLYSEPEVSVREMIQNAHDSCLRRMAEDTEFNAPRIEIDAKPFDRTLTFRDNGSGLTEPEIHEFLATVGKGYTGELRRALADSNRDIAEKLIGQFGLGLLSAFIIAENIEIRTRSFKPDATGLSWRCDGNVTYTVVERPKDDIGSEVVIAVSPNYVNTILKEEVLEQVVKTYADFLSIPIYLNGSRLPANVMDAPWHRQASDTEYRDYVRQRYEDIPPLEVIPIEHEEDGVCIQGVLYIPRHAMLEINTYGDLDIYVSRMFICKGDRDLLPVWAKFVRGVIDSPSLTPTLSRETVRRDDKYRRVQEILSRSILAHLEKLAHEAPRQLSEVVTSHNTLIKAWALEDDGFFDRICDLVLFDTEYGKMNIPTYFARYGERSPSFAHTTGGQVEDEASAATSGADSAAVENGSADDKRQTIYYFSEVGSGTQQKILFKEAGLCVIDASYGAEEAFLRKYDERHDDVEVKKLDAGAGYIFETVEDKDGKLTALEEEFRLRKIAARVTKFRPMDIPAVLLRVEEDDRHEAAIRKMVEEPDINPELKSFFKRVLQERDGYQKQSLTRGAALHLNASNPIIQKLAEGDREDPLRDLAMTVLYNNAVLFESHSVTPENAQLMFRANNMTIEHLIAKQQKVVELENDLTHMKLEHASALEAQRQYARSQEQKAKDTVAQVAEAEKRVAAQMMQLEEAEEARQELEQRHRAEVERLNDQVADAENVQEELRNSKAVIDAELARLQEKIVGVSELVKTINTRPNDVFVMRPFRDNIRWVYDQAIKPACDAKGLTPINLEDAVHAALISKEIITHIRECGILIADVTDCNPNVMYEVGAAHILGKTEQTILLARDTEKLSFDIRPFRAISYGNEGAIAGLRTTIERSLDSILERRMRG